MVRVGIFTGDMETWHSLRNTLGKHMTKPNSRISIPGIITIKLFRPIEEDFSEKFCGEWLDIAIYLDELSDIAKREIHLSMFSSKIKKEIDLTKVRLW